MLLNEPYLKRLTQLNSLLSSSTSETAAAGAAPAQPATESPQSLTVVTSGVVSEPVMSVGSATAMQLEGEEQITSMLSEALSAYV